MSKPDTTKTFVYKYEDEIKKYFTNNLINKEIISEIPNEKYENIFKSAKDQKIGPKSQMSYYLLSQVKYI